MKYKILGIIPARGGSKGIPKKNIINVAGKPLLAWTVEAAKKSGILDRIVVSSDSDEILAVAKKYGADVLKRPENISGDNASPAAVIIHALKEYRKVKYIPDYVMYLQPTSPLRNAKHVRLAFNALKTSKSSALISVSEANNKFLKAFTLKSDGRLKGISNDTFPFMNRQKLPKIYMSNGAIYIYTAKDFLKNKKFWVKGAVPFVMSAEESADLDSLEDKKIIENYLRHRTKLGK